MQNPAMPERLGIRRLTVGMASLLAAGLAFTACSSSSSSGSSAPSEGAKTVDMTPKASAPLKTLDWDLPYGEPTTLDYVKAADYGPDMVVSNLCDSLLRLEPDYSSSPSLATSWKTSSDHLTTTFTLRTVGEVPVERVDRP